MDALVQLSTGARFGRLVVLGDGGRTDRGAVMVLCMCDCGRRRAVLASRLRTGKAKSCGCLRAEIIAGSQPLREADPLHLRAALLPSLCFHRRRQAALLYVEGRRVAEIAKAMGTSAGSVRYLLRSARLAVASQQATEPEHRLSSVDTAPGEDPLRQSPLPALRAHLSARQLEVVLPFRAGASQVDIARSQGVSKATVTILLRRARATLLGKVARSAAEVVARQPVPRGHDRR